MLRLKECCDICVASRIQEAFSTCSYSYAKIFKPQSTTPIGAYFNLQEVCILKSFNVKSVECAINRILKLFNHFATYPCCHIIYIRMYWKAGHSCRIRKLVSTGIIIFHLFCHDNKQNNVNITALSCLFKSFTFQHAQQIYNMHELDAVGAWPLMSHAVYQTPLRKNYYFQKFLNFNMCVCVCVS